MNTPFTTSKADKCTLLFLMEPTHYWCRVFLERFSWETITRCFNRYINSHHRLHVNISFLFLFLKLSQFQSCPYCTNMRLTSFSLSSRTLEKKNPLCFIIGTVPLIQKQGERACMSNVAIHRRKMERGCGQGYSIHEQWSPLNNLPTVRMSLPLTVCVCVCVLTKHSIRAVLLLFLVLGVLKHFLH